MQPPRRRDYTDEFGESTPSLSDTLPPRFVGHPSIFYTSQTSLDLRRRKVPPAPADTVANDPLLLKFGLIINRTHHVLICPDPQCGIIIHPKRAREHIVQTHKRIE